MDVGSRRSLHSLAHQCSYVLKSIAVFTVAGKWKDLSHVFFLLFIFCIVFHLRFLWQLQKVQFSHWSSQRLHFVDLSVNLPVVFESCQKQILVDVIETEAVCFCMRDIIGTLFRITLTCMWNPLTHYTEIFQECVLEHFICMHEGISVKTEFVSVRPASLQC